MDFRLNLHTETIEHADPAVPVAVDPQVPLREVLATMRTREIGSVLVCRNRRLLGIFTERDALKLLAEGRSLDTPLEAVMTPEPVTLQVSDTVGTAIRKMSFGNFRRLPVVDGAGRVVGLASASRILHYIVEYFPHTVYTLPPEPHPVMHEREGA